MKLDFYEPTGKNRIISTGPASAWDLVMRSVPDTDVLPYQLQRIFYDSTTIQDAINNMERHYFNDRTRTIQIYTAINQNAKITSLVRDYISSVLNKTIILGKSKDDINSVSTKRICDKKWFRNLCKDILRAQFWGYSCNYLGEWNGLEMVGGQTIRRELIDPDRRIKKQYPELPNGPSLDDPLMALHYALITTDHDEGRMPCGYGLFFKIMLEYLYYKSTRTGQAGFLQKFGSPSIHVQTDAADNQFIADPKSDNGAMMQNPNWVNMQKTMKAFSSSGAFLSNMETKVALLQANQAGKNDPFTIFLNSQFEAIKGLILGHENAQAKTPGMLGSSIGGVNSPEAKSKEDVIADACKFLCETLNSVILNKLVFLGVKVDAGDIFFIPDDAKKNSDKITKIDISTKIFEMAARAKEAGIGIPLEWIKEETGIPVVKDTSIEDSKKMAAEQTNKKPVANEK